MNEIKISNKKIGNKTAPFIVAEMSANHNQSLNKALEIVNAAKKTGVDAIKLQTYTPYTLTLNVNNKDFKIGKRNSLWKKETLYSLYEKAYTPWEWHKKIFNHCKKLGLICFSTPFDESAVDFLETLDVPCYKIGSFENNHIPLLKKIAQTKKPVIMSTGMASISELDEAVKTLRENGCKDLILLKCTSAYPATAEDANLLTIPHMQKLFDCQVGLSDHTLGIGVSLAGVALCATFIEKHFTLKRSDGGPDAAFSMQPDEMKNLVIESKKAWQALGKVCYNKTKNEEKSMIFRRSIYVSKNIKAGEKFTKENIRIVRPGFGLHPRHYDLLIGKISSKNLKIGTAINLENLYIKN